MIKYMKAVPCSELFRDATQSPGKSPIFSLLKISGKLKLKINPLGKLRLKIELNFKVIFHITPSSCQLLVQLLDIDISTRFKVSLFTVLLSCMDTRF